MATLVYVLCMLTSALCAALLLRSCGTAGAPRLLFWSGPSFAVFALSNAMVILDLLVFPNVDLAIARAGSAFVAVTLLLYGLVWDGD